MSDTVLVLTGTHGGEEIRYVIGEGRHVVGRAADSDLVLAHGSVSRQHAALVCRDGRVHVEDLGSHNGTRVNGAVVSGPTELASGDEVRFADVALRFGDPCGRRGSLTIAPEATGTGIAVPWDEVRRSASVDAGEREGAGTGQRKRSELFRCLADAGDLLTVPRPPEELFEPILDLVEDAMTPERIFLLLTDEESDEPRIRASRCRVVSVDDDVTLSRTVVARVLEERASFLLEDDGLGGDLMQQQSIVSAGIRSAMAAPLFDNKRVIGLLYADTTDPVRRYTRDELVAFSLLANVIAVALTHARADALEAEKRRLETELTAAREIMTRFLPAELPALPGWSLCALVEPCYEVGGDLYDVTRLSDGRVAVAVGAVSGKGLGAALLVSSLLPLLRAMVESESDLAKLTGHLNRQLWRTTDPVRYATLFLGVLDPASGRMTYVNAGHCPPVVGRAGGAWDTVAPTGMPVALLEENVWTSGELTLAPGDLLALCSDGISETWNDQDDDYGEERFYELLAAHRAEPVEAIRDAVLGDVAAFRGGAPVGDDLTLMVVKRDAVS